MKTPKKKSAIRNLPAGKAGPKTAIVEQPPLRLEWIEAGSLADNPANWRVHPRGQMKALKGMIGDVGWAGALLYNEATNRLIDGHARKKAVSPSTPVPVLIGSWDAATERKILASLDPLAAMAETDTAALEALLGKTDLSAEGLGDLEAMLAELAAGDGDAESPTEDTEKDEKKTAKKKARRRGVSDLFAVSVFLTSQAAQVTFYKRMRKEGLKCKMFMA